MNFSMLRNCARALGAIGMLLLAVHAQAAGNWENGKAQYGTNNTPPNGTCVNCHNADVTQSRTVQISVMPPIFQTYPAVSTRGTASYLQGRFNAGALGTQMGSPHTNPLRSVSDTTINDTVSDIAAYIANPNFPTASVSPSSHGFGTVTAFNTATKSIRLTNNGSGALHVSGVSIDDATNFAFDASACTAADVAASGGTCDIVVTFKPQSVASFDNRTMTISHNTFGGSSTVTLSGTGGAPAALSVSPATSSGAPATFSAHLNVSSGKTNWMLNNTGWSGTSITLGTIAIPTNYTLDGTSTCASGTVLTGGSSANQCMVILSYKPTTVGTVDAQATIAHSIAGSPTTLYLQGTGIGDPSLTLGAVTPAFPVTLLGHPISGSVTVTNGGTAAASVGTVAITGPFTQTNGCDSTSLASGSTCNVNVTFNPVAVGDSQSATLTVPYATGLSVQGTLSASAKQLTTVPAASPTMQTARTTSTTTSIQINNPSGVGTFLAPIALSGSANFAITSNNCSATLAAASFCSIVVTFTPDSDSAVSTTLNVRYGPSAAQNTTQSIPLVINGSTQLISVIGVTPSSLTFPPTLPGATSTLSVDIGNSGNAALNLTSIALADNLPADFSITGNTCGPSIAVGAPACRVTVVFTPSTQSPRTARIVVTHNAAGGTTNIALSGSALLRPLVSLSPTTLDFGSVIVNTASPLQSTVLTNTGNIDLHLGAITITGGSAAEYTQVGSTCAAGAVVTPASSCRVTLRFTPSALSNRNATLQISHDAAGSPSSVLLSGIGVSAPAPDIQTNQTALLFAPLIVQTASPAQSITVRNSGTANLLFSRIAPSGSAAADFALAGSCSLGTPLVSGATCTVNVVFTPSAVGLRSAPLSIESNATRGPVTIPLSGTGQAVPAPAVSLTPNTLDFGPQTVGGLYPPGTVQLLNAGSAVMHITGIAASGPGFTASSNCAATLLDGGSCAISVAFAPTSAGASYSGQVMVSSDAPGSPHVVALSGQGTATTVPVVTWSPLIGALAFGDVATGSVSAIQSVQLLNQGPGGVTLNVVNTIGSHAPDFSLTGTCIPGSVLLQGKTCRIDVVFVPGSAGAKKATIQVASTGTRPPDVQLGGNGLGGPSPSLAVSATALSFDAIRIGTQSVPTEVTLSSNGSGVVRVTGMVVSGPFAMQNKTCPSAPFTLQAGAECTVTVTFVPQAEGNAPGLLSVSTDASPALREVALSGKGEAKADVSSGGCSIGTGDSLADPTLWVLSLLAVAALLYRQRARRRSRVPAHSHLHRPQPRADQPRRRQP